MGMDAPPSPRRWYKVALMNSSTSQRKPRLPPSDPAASADHETVRATVIELIPEYHVVHLETKDGRGLALTAKTAGIDLASLRVGQAVDCVVTLVQPRVVQAHALA
jgi:hypothetical protein